MSENYRHFYGLKCEPFSNDIAIKDLLKLPDMIGVRERLDYCLSIGGIMLVTGEVGSGKSTSLRWSLSHLHPSQTLVLPLVAHSGSLLEILKAMAGALGLSPNTSARSRLIDEIKAAVRDHVSVKKQLVVFVIDEANLLRSDVFAELHTLTQFEFDSKNLISLVLCGQTTLFDKLQMRTAAPLASRVIARSHLSPLNRSRMEEYLQHHLQIAGVKKRLFDDGAITAIFQGSAGLLRKANALARGSLLSASIEQRDLVTSEHVRIAASELI